MNLARGAATTCCQEASQVVMQSLSSFFVLGWFTASSAGYAGSATPNIAHPTGTASITYSGAAAQIGPLEARRRELDSWLQKKVVRSRLGQETIKHFRSPSPRRRQPFR